MKTNYEVLLHVRGSLAGLLAGGMVIGWDWALFYFGLKAQLLINFSDLGAKHGDK